MYAKIENDIVVEYPLSEYVIMKRFPNVSWVVGEFYPPEGYVEVNSTEGLPYDSRIQNLIEGSPTLGDDGLWHQTWTVEEATQEEVISRINTQWLFIRSERDNKLKLSDWTQVLDAPVDQTAWAVYRQALRDITEQSDPFNIIWPTPPQ